MQNVRGEQSNHCACDGSLEYRNRTSSNPSRIFSHRSGISTSLVTCTRPGGRRTCFWTAPGARLCRPPWAEQRSLRVSGASAPVCELLVPGRINGDLDITLRTCLPPAIKIPMLLEAAMLRYCTIMATINEGAGTRARDSARPAARRPGPRNRAGAVSVLGRL